MHKSIRIIGCLSTVSLKSFYNRRAWKFEINLLVLNVTIYFNKEHRRIIATEIGHSFTKTIAL